jgi:ABC-2 type transport system ATP-binding protein
VILSTHNLPEVTAVCNRILLVHRGRLVADGTPVQIQASHGGGNTTIIRVVPGQGNRSVRDVLEEVEGVSRALRLESPGEDGEAWRVDASGEEDLRPVLFRCAVQSGWTLLELRRERLDLETIFQRLTLQ